MTFSRLLLPFGVLAALALQLVARESTVHIDIAKPPTEETARDLLAQGPETASAEIWQALGEAYEPARTTMGGATKKESFRAWVRLASWFSLLARTDEQEFARFLLPYLAHAEEEGERRLFFRLPDTQFSPDVEPVTDEFALEIAENPNSREKNLESFIPGDFQWKDGTLDKYLGGELTKEFTASPEHLQEFLETLDPGDFTPGVMQNLRRLHAHKPENFSKYFNLALAMAVVFDQLPPPDWPHHQVDEKSLPKDDQTIEQRFDFWVESHANRKLLVDPARLGADQLKFVVDALVPQEELRFAQDQLRFSRSSFHKAYSSIRYDHDRVKTQEFSWPSGTPYTLAAIQKDGGICVDQAYFAMIAGKARGIPTLYFTGQGADGGHAWFGFLRSDTQWNMDAGRYENQNYAVGAALDPQVWERITDHELKFLGQRVRRSPAFQAGAADLVMAQEFMGEGKLDRALEAASSALKMSPQNPDAWDLKLELLKLAGEPFSEIQEHLEAAAKNFNGEPDLRTHYQTLLVAAAREHGDEELAAQLERRMIGQNANRRSDLSVNAASEKIVALLDEGNIDEAMRDFRSQVNRLGKTGGGEFFYSIVRPIVDYLVNDGELRDAKRVLSQARRALRPDRGSILDQELAALEEKCDPRRR